VKKVAISELLIKNVSSRYLDTIIPKNKSQYLLSTIVPQLMIDETRLKKLQDLLKIASEGLTREEFLKSFQAAIDLILKVEKKQDDKFQKTLDDLKTQIEELANSNESDFTTLKADFQKKINLALNDQAAGMNLIRDKVRKIKEGKDGKDGINGLNGSDGSPGAPGRDGSPDTAEDIVSKLESLTGQNRLDVSAIKGLEDRLKLIKPTPQTGFNYGALDLHLIDDETPTGTPNGVLRAFVLSRAPSPIGSLKVYVNGQRMRKTEDYTFSGSTITFNTAPPTGSVILVDYRI
jgi:hypothetical protein